MANAILPSVRAPFSSKERLDTSLHDCMARRAISLWHFAVCEAALLVLAEWGPSEMLRRVLISGVIGFLWVVGFAATPESYKRWIGLLGRVLLLLPGLSLLLFLGATSIT